MSRPSISLALALFAALAASSPVLARQQSGTSEDPEPPLEIGLEEAVEVRFVLVDFLVLDRAGRTVPGLGSDDFKLLIAGRRAEIETLDENCPAGAVDDAVSGADPVPPPPRPDGEPHRIVIVFDYDHLSEPALTFENALRMIDRYPTGDEEHMLVSLGEVVRIEVPFTRDVDELRWALQRMRNDRELFGGNRGRATERRFFYRIKALFDILSRYPGRKTVVLFSGPFMPDEFFHDPELRELSALSGISRTAVYPVDTAGLQAHRRFGGPEQLRRLAIETGGRMTAQTNDLGLAYAKAQRDLGCTYTLGFRDTKVKPDDNRRIQIKLPKKKGFRIVQPDYYVIRSAKAETKSLRETAGMAPHLYEDEAVQARLDVIGTKASDRWLARISVEFDPDADERDTTSRWRLEGFLRKPRGTVIRSFQREFTLTPEQAAGETPVRLFEEIGAPPGEFAVSVIVADPKGGVPRSRVWPVTLAPVPVEGPFLVGPVLGRSGDDGFEPSLRPAVGDGQVLEGLAGLCVGGGTEAGPASLEWIIEAPTGETLGALPPTVVRPEGRGPLKCGEVVAPLAPGELPAGEYSLRVKATAEGYLAESGSTPFVVVDGPDAEAP